MKPITSYAIFALIALVLALVIGIPATTLVRHVFDALSVVLVN